MLYQLHQGGWNQYTRTETTRCGRCRGNKGETEGSNRKHKLESRLPGEISITSDMQMTPP